MFMVYRSYMWKACVKCMLYNIISEEEIKCNIELFVIGYKFDNFIIGTCVLLTNCYLYRGYHKCSS